MITIKDLLENALIMAKKAKFSEPQLEVELLLGWVIKKPRAFIMAHGETKLSKTQIALFNRLLAKRLDNYSLAYITGHREFYGLDFLVNKHTLIPRPETELLVETMLNDIKACPSNKIIIDIGCGSGCIMISLAKNLSTKTNYFFGLDVSSGALKMTQTNARKQKIKNYHIMKSDLLKSWLKKYQAKLKSYPLFIAANLPYLTPQQIASSPSIKHEPRLALTAGNDGLKYYRQLFKQIKNINQPLALYCEIDPRQKTNFKKLAKLILPKFSLQIKSDLAGLDRLMILKNFNS